VRLLTLGLVLWASAANAQGAADAPGARLRLLDKLTGQVTDMTLENGQAQTVGRLTVQVDDCRYPADNPTADASAHLTIRDTSQPEPMFKGWMVASSPALSALDHPRYDVWVLRCDVPDRVLPDVPAPTEEPPPEGGVEGEATDGGNG
jgi:hypothetical protein